MRFCDRSKAHELPLDRPRDVALNLQLPLVPYEPRHEKTRFMPYANNKGADQPAHLRSLISTFVVHCLDSIIPILAIAKISIL